MSGQVFGRLTVVKLADKRGTIGQLYWECRCACGAITAVVGGGLRSGKTKSCGSWSCVGRRQAKEVYAGVSAAELAVILGMTAVGIRVRFNKGVSGDDLLAPPDPAKSHVRRVAKLH